MSAPIVLRALKEIFLEALPSVAFVGLVMAGVLVIGALICSVPALAVIANFLGLICLATVCLSMIAHLVYAIANAISNVVRTKIAEIRKREGGSNE